MTRRKHHRSALGLLYQWHRYLGLGIALLAVMLSLTGIMLNHTDRLGLTVKHIRHPDLLAWYGIYPAEGRFFRVGGHWISQWGEQLYLDDKRLPFGFEREPVGVIASPPMIVIAEPSALLLLSEDGQLIERLDKLTGVPEGIRAIAPGAHDQVIVKTPAGLFRGNLSTGDWTKTDRSATWSREAVPPEALRQAISAHHPGASLSLERIILDLHSGRLFGAWGSRIMDVAAILLLFNAASGVLIWWWRRCNQQRKGMKTRRS